MEMEARRVEVHQVALDALVANFRHHLVELHGVTSPDADRTLSLLRWSRLDARTK